MNDFRGLLLKVGDRIAYATSSSNNVSIIEGEIVEIIEPCEIEDEWGRKDEEGRLKVLTNQGYEYRGSSVEDKMKVVTITRPNRVARLDQIYNKPLAKRKY